jgi:putative transposase
VSVAAFIVTQRAQHGVPVAAACRALSVSQAWFYKWCHGDPSPRRARRAQLATAIGQLFAAHHGRYGSPRITADLREAGWRVSENTLAQIMAERRLVARPKRRRGTTRPGRGRWRAPDLIGRDFPAQRLNQKWYGDGTELPTDEGKLYLASVLDMGSRRVVGFAIGEHHDAQLAYGALAMAVAVRGGQVTHVIMHTDQGSEYTAQLFRAACTRLHLRQSMGRVGSALDNATGGTRPARCARRSTTSWQCTPANTTRERWHDHRTRPRRPQCGAVLTGVKATPSGWPAASLDTGYGRHPTAPVEGQTEEDQNSKIHLTRVSTETGDCQCADPPRIARVDDGGLDAPEPSISSTRTFVITSAYGSVGRQSSVLVCL